MNLTPDDKEEKLLVKILVIVIVIIVIIAIIGAIFISMGLRNLLNRFDNLASVPFVEYEAYYNVSLDLYSIEHELEYNNISTLTGFMGSSPYSYKVCSFGKGFNNVSFNDTICYIYDQDKSFNTSITYVSLRLYDEYDGQVISRTWDEMESDLEKSMEYIIDIIYDVTGERPDYCEFIREDGSSLPYPRS